VAHDLVEWCGSTMPESLVAATDGAFAGSPATGHLFVLTNWSSSRSHGLCSLLGGSPVQPE